MNFVCLMSMEFMGVSSVWLCKNDDSVAGVCVASQDDGNNLTFQPLASPRDFR